jgi:hypothetical protein
MKHYLDEEQQCVLTTGVRRQHLYVIQLNRMIDVFRQTVWRAV